MRLSVFAILATCAATALAETTEERITKIVTEIFSVLAEQIAPDTDFIEDLGADEQDFTEIQMAVEEEFDIEVNDSVVQPRLRTVTLYSDYVDSVSGGEI